MVVLIIYTFSWLILLAYYLYGRKDNTFTWSESDNMERFVILLLFLFAPLIVLYIPFSIISGYREKRRKQKAEEERNREKRGEMEYRMAALTALHQAKINENEEEGSHDFQSFLASVKSAYSTNFYTHMQKEENYPLILKLLYKLTLPERAKLHVEKCKQQGSGDTSKLFVETPEGAYDYCIWDHISVECSKEGAWNAYILYNLWHVLPMFWHALYDRRYYLFEAEYTQFVDFLNKEDTEPIRQAMKPLFTSPDVVETNGKFYVSCCYFTNFGGLIQETIEITIANGKASFHEIERKTLLEYQCGIMF